MAYETRNPYTGELLEAYPDATDNEVNHAIENAHAAFLLWKETEFAERACVMHSVATILRRDVDFFAKLLTVEMGKLVSEAKAEIALSADIFDYYANNAEALLAPEKLPVANPDEGDAVLSAEPLGVLLAIEPWNFPFYQVARIAAPQLSAGNTMLLKHASNVPQAAAAFENLLLGAGLPPGGCKKH